MRIVSNIKVKKQTKAMDELVKENARERNAIGRLNDRNFWRLLPKRNKNGHKGTFGKVLVIAGSFDMAGAAILSARAALRSGCGMVKVITPEANREILQISVPEALLVTYDNELDEDEIYDAFDWSDVILIGPGLSMDDFAHDLVDMVLEEEPGKPLVIDADALNIISKEENQTRLHGKNAVITPHLGEMSRLVGMPIAEIERHMVETAEAFCAHHAVSVVLKGSRSVICSPKRKTYENVSGNCGMASAGSGDVLAGVIASLLAQGMKLPDASVLGTYIHGRAGDFAAEVLSEYSMTASDIIDHLGDVFLLAARESE